MSSHRTSSGTLVTARGPRADSTSPQESTAAPSTLGLLSCSRNSQVKAAAASASSLESVMSLASCLTARRASCWVWGCSSVTDSWTSGWRRSGREARSRAQGGASLVLTTSRALRRTLGAGLASREPASCRKRSPGSRERDCSSTFSDSATRFLLSLAGMATVRPQYCWMVRMVASTSRLIISITPSSSSPWIKDPTWTLKALSDRM